MWLAVTMGFAVAKGHFHIHVSGFSESRYLVDQGALAELSCNKTDSLDKIYAICSKENGKKNTSFLAFCREEAQAKGGIYELPCANGSLSLAWKSFAYSKLDPVIEAFLVKHAQAQPDVLTMAVYSVGTHHFAWHVGEHTMNHHHHLNDNWMPPQPWIDYWVNATTVLMTRLQQLRTAGVCCVWKTNNIGARPVSAAWHHPSVEGGLHDYMNSFAVALARQHGVPVVDLRAATVAMTKAMNNNESHDESALKGMNDYDFYHAYDHRKLWRMTWEKTLQACAGNH
jgi:hypothetical protein